MGLLILLKFAVKCFDILAWPLFALGYPLCASIRAIESNSNSDIRKLATYWVLFSLISLFDHAFARVLEWLSFWPYVKLMAIFWLVVPHFDVSSYVYKHLVRPCLSLDPYVVIERFNQRKEEFFLKRENFLVEAERYVKENKPEALERLIASKCSKPSVEVQEIKAVAATEKNEVEQLNCKEPNVAQKQTKEVEITEKKGVAVELKCKEPNVTQKETKAREVTEEMEVAAAKWVKRTVPNLAQTENRTFAAAGNKEMATTTAVTAASDSKLPGIPALKKVQKEWTCAPCQVTTTSETLLNSHLQGKKHKAVYEELKTKNQAAKNKDSPSSTAKKSGEPKVEPKKCVSSNGSNQTNLKTPEEQSWQMNPPKTAVETKQSPFWCNICNIRGSSESDMASHRNGKKHLARVQELSVVWCNIRNVGCTSEINMASHYTNQIWVEKKSLGL